MLTEFDTRCDGMGGMTFSVCSTTCGKSCRDLQSEHPRCDSECVPGCVCPEGQYLTDGPSPACVEKAACTCHDEFAPDQLYQAGDMIERHCGTWYT